MGYRISQAAELSGVPATTIRYYEGRGLLRPGARDANGSRVYDDRDVARLRFLGRARALDLPADGLAELLELWEDQECAPVAERLHERAADRLAETQRRIAALASLAGELQRVLARLQDPPHEGPCVEGECVCLDDRPAPATSLPLTTSPDGHPEHDDLDGRVVCTLAPEDMPGRMDDWQRLLDRSTGQEPIPGGASLRFPAEPELAAELARVATAEHGCCRFFAFHLRVTDDAVHLQVTGPPEARPVIASLFGVPGAAAEHPA